MMTSVERADQRPTAAAGMAALFFLGAVLLATALVVGVINGHGTPAATTGRMASSVVLVVTGWLAYLRWGQPGLERFAFWIALGMTLGAIGDFFNAELLTFIPLPDPVLGGI